MYRPPLTTQLRQGAGDLPSCRACVIQAGVVSTTRRPARRHFPARHGLCLSDVAPLGCWNSGAPLNSLVSPDTGPCGTNRKVSTDHD